MALADITLVDSEASPVSHVMKYIATNGGKVVRADLAAAVEAPIIFTIGHQVRKVSGRNLQSHLARLDWTVLDSDGVTPYANNMRVMCDIFDPVLSDALVDNLTASLTSFMTEANMRLLARASVF